MRIRTANPEDAAGIRAVNISAFGTKAEADLVDALRERAAPIISLVADDGGNIVGHILFTPMTLDADRGMKVMGLAPLAVATGKQRQGIGAALVHAGLDECWQSGAAAVAVLGHAEYYPRFGFAPASKFGLRSQYDVPDDVFMIVEGRRGALAGKHGLLSYHPAFAELNL
jgi:putative acetyltransferase